MNHPTGTSSNLSTNSRAQSSIPPKPNNSSSKPSRTSGSTSQTSSFTRLKQDQQARNKEPDDVNYEGESSDEELTGRSYDLFGNESYTTVITRREAVAVLDNPELLMMHAQARNASIPATRLHFLARLSGRVPTSTQEAEASERRLAQLKKIAQKRELADAGMVETGSSSRDGGASS
ncbi:hypothetical protein SBOR_3606 [Sclerotinia borealis F-4128]|uniref:Uncharacterized protein n=1 Tax=Sclerotinia borealis (strain F-4128) TaxID=1432307 RepID=W9CJ52_SCLBF|nr:hypothetical protein SBOR_3606 [Sclerotinia borealis F-4128]